MTKSALPLSGISVLDASRVLAGPYCCAILGDLGADVIKVERPGTGDESRQWGHLWHGIGLDFLNVNRNKRGITLDLRNDDAREIFRELAARADVLVENFVPGTMERFGLAYEDLVPLNEGLIYCSISAYGDTGPLRRKPGYDGALQAFSGHMAITGEADGGPVRTGASVIDMSTGIAAHGAILAALYGREKTGRGQRVSMSLLHTALALMGTHGAVCLNTGSEPTRAGSGVSHLAPYAAYKTMDSYIVAGALNDEAWRKLCQIISREDLAGDPRFRDQQARVTHRRDLDEALQAAFCTKGSSEWIDIFERAGLVISQLNTLKEALEHPQVVANEFVRSIDHAADPLLYISAPMTFGGWDSSQAVPPPELGQHTTEILSELGYSAEKIRELEAAGAI